MSVKETVQISPDLLIGDSTNRSSGTPVGLDFVPSGHISGLGFTIPLLVSTYIPQTSDIEVAVSDKVPIDGSYVIVTTSPLSGVVGVQSTADAWLFELDVMKFCVEKEKNVSKINRNMKFLFFMLFITFLF